MRASRVAALLILCCAIGKRETSPSTIPPIFTGRQRSLAAASSSENYFAGDARTATCPEDSVPDENGACKCAGHCPHIECSSDHRPVQLKPADPETPGSCCARFTCVPSDSRGTEPCPENSVLTEDGKCECAPCPRASCQPGYRPEPLRPALDRDTSASCCPLYECRPAESVSWVTEMEKSAKFCIYENKARKLGERWQQSACVSCVCQENGEVSCQEPMCKSCENAIPPDPGECCPHCPPPKNATLSEIESEPEPEPELPCSTSLQGCSLSCDHGYRKQDDGCPICSCAPAKDDDDDDETVEVPAGSFGLDDACPELSVCDLTCELAKDERGCSVCACRALPVNDTGLVDKGGKKICPEVKCDLHCDRGLVMDENDCTFCKCKLPDSGCPPLVGCRKRCPFGYKTNKRGCPTCRCRATCVDHLNQTHSEGSMWQPNPCGSCICEAGGKLSCWQAVCSVACADPLPPNPGTCCPICPIAPTKEDGPSSQQGGKGWGTVPITLIAILSLLCLLLIAHILRGRFRARLSPSEPSYSTYPPQYYKCVPAYDTPVHRNEKIVPL